MSRWQYWSRGTSPQLGFSSFTMLAEAGRVMPGDPEQIAAQQGWTSKGYGWYQDQNGQTVARNVNGQMVIYDEPPSDAQTQVDAGNPTGAPTGQKPADRARSMGLRSNGRGGYVDPESGQVVARTVNNELVFYDRGPGGGVVSDGAGGQNAAIEQPSWQDPVTGLVVVPPAKPETPAETAAIPDPIPAQPPQGFADFIQRSKMDAYAKNQQQTEINQEVEQQSAAVEELYNSHDVMRDMKIEMDQLIQDAEESGDEYRMQMAAGIKDYMNENGETFKEYFDTVPVERHIELSNHILDYVIAKVKKDYADENGLYDQYLEADPETQADLKEKVFTNADSYEYQIQNMMDDAQGIEAIDSEPFGSQEIVSDYTNWKLTDEHNPGDDMLSSGLDNDGQADVYNAADQVARENGMKDPGPIISIDWSAPGAEEDGEDNKKIALSALKAWRTEVLPTLPMGSIVYGNPSNTQRGRIYKLAGFGSVNDDYFGQYGLVVRGLDGENQIVPVNPGGEMEEAFGHRVNYNLRVLHEHELFSEEVINNIYEALLT